MSDGMLDGRVVLVTGGGRGLGRSHCLELASHGACVVVNDLGVALDGDASQESPAREVVSAIEAAGGSGLADDTSVTDWSGVQKLIERAVGTFGRLDAVVNNAGIVRDRMITSMSEQDFDLVIDVHLKGTFSVTKHACDYWRSLAKSGAPVAGRIINTTSAAGLLGSLGQSAYGPAKAAIANLTLVTALEMTRYSVTANAISPIAATRMTATMKGGGLGSRDAEGWDPHDPANASPVVAWLASEDSAWLTGAILRIDGSELQRVHPWTFDAQTHVARSGERLDAAELPSAMRRLYGIAPASLGGMRRRRRERS